MPSACAMSRIDVAAYPWRANSSRATSRISSRRFTAAFTTLASRSRISCTTNERSLASRTQRALSSVAGGRVPEIKLEDMETREGFMRSRKPEHVTLLPDPPQAPRHLPIISTDDHLVEPPDMFEGRMPAKYADLAPRVVDRRRRQPGLALRRQGQPERRSGRGRRSPDRGVLLRTGALRRDAPRRRGTSTRACTTWTSTACTRRCASPRPSPGSAATACSSASSDPELALAALRACERLAPRGMGRRAPRPLRAVPDPVAPRSRGRSRRGPPQRGARLQGDLVLARTPNRSGCRRSTPATGTRCSAACEETETVVCLHVGSSGATPTTVERRAGRRDRRAVLRLSRCSRRSTGSTPRSRCGSRT